MKKLIPIILFSLLSCIAGFAQKSRFKWITVKPTAPKPKKPAPPADSSWLITYEMTREKRPSGQSTGSTKARMSWSYMRRALYPQMARKKKHCLPFVQEESQIGHGDSG